MNYWVTPTGTVYEGDFIGFHSSFCNRYIKDHLNIEDSSLKWLEKNPDKHLYEYFEEVLNWIRYCDWGHNPSWVTESNNYTQLENRDIIIHQRRLTKKQKERMFELTGYL